MLVCKLKYNYERRKFMEQKFEIEEVKFEEESLDIEEIFEECVPPRRC